MYAWTYKINGEHKIKKITLHLQYECSKVFLQNKKKMIQLVGDSIISDFEYQIIYPILKINNTDRIFGL